MRSRFRVMLCTAPVMAGRTTPSVSTESKTASLSSCRSRLYPVGSPFSTVIIAIRLPTSRPDLPRVSSATSGFRFWGISEDPVV